MGRVNGVLVGWGAWGGWAGLVGLVGASLKRKLVYSKMERCVSTENMSFRMANSNKQFLFIFF